MSFSTVTALYAHIRIHLRLFNWRNADSSQPRPALLGSPAPALGMDGVGTAMGMPIPLLPLFSLLLLPPLLPLREGQRQRVGGLC